MCVCVCVCVCVCGHIQNIWDISNAYIDLTQMVYFDGKRLLAYLFIRHIGLFSAEVIFFFKQLCGFK